MSMGLLSELKLQSVAPPQAFFMKVLDSTLRGLLQPRAGARGAGLSQPPRACKELHGCWHFWGCGRAGLQAVPLLAHSALRQAP